ncbi:MAG: T9SS type A sorting domain-containing protein [Salinivirgaceae bacterium]|nr:T9SS type A sorting domain-containing protein [Salinivirgaceae bacterium]
MLLLLCCPSIYAQSKQLLPDNGKRHASNGLTIRESNAKHLRLTANIGAISLNDTTTKKGDFLELQTEGSYMSGAEGEPQLPAFRKLVQIPNGAKPIIVIKHADTTFYALSDLNIDKKLSPRQPLQSKSGDVRKFKYKKRAYRRNYYTQNELVTISQVGSMRGVEIGQVSVNPVRYNPKQNTLMVFSNIDFEIEFEGGSAKVGSNEATPYFNDVYTSLANYKSPTVETSGQPVKYLIITDTAFVKSLQEFIIWKRQKGFNVVVATTDVIGKSATEIKNWISTQYHSATNDNPAPSFLLLAADTDKIPASQNGTVTGYGTDLYYACMDGKDDNIPDMYYGRFSARTAEQMKAIVDKTITYEKYEFEDPSYLSKATLIAGEDRNWNPDVAVPTVNYITKYRINAENGYSKVKKFTSGYSGCYADSCVAVGLMAYTAHGTITKWDGPVLEQSQVRNFSFRGKFPFVVANCCLSGQFTSDECLGETWLRKENSGAVAYIGSSPKTYWYPDFYWAAGAHYGKAGVCPDTSTTTTGAFDTPFVSDYVCGGAIMFAGNMAVTEACDNGYPSSMTGNWDTYYWEGYNYLGDPSLLVYFGEPKDNTVSLNITMPVNSSFATVNAASGSYVALSLNGELLGAAYVAKGEQSVNVPIKPVSTPGEIDVVVTKPRYKPYFGKITAILPDKSFLVIMDNPFKNKSMQYGGNASFDVKVNNLGQQASQTATVNITSTSPHVKSIGAAQTSIPSIGSQSFQTYTNLCHIELHSNIADGTKIPFKFTITEDGRTTKSEFLLNVTAPRLKLVQKATFDKPNGQMLPGETADIIIPITNIGHERIDAATVKLTADNGQPKVLVINDEHSISNLNPGDTALCRFTITADEYADMMTLFGFKVTATASQPQHSDSCHYTMTIGKLDEKIIGTGTQTEYHYPFNNYYKNSHSQIVYTAADLGNKPISIEELVWQFSYITPKNKFNGYKDFTLKMKYYKEDNLKGLEYFIDMSDAETVLKIDLLKIDSKTLELKFDKPFVYDGKSNVLLDLTWGKNSNFVELDYAPEIYCHSTNKASVARNSYDDHDDDGNPINSGADIKDVYKSTSYRPNTTFRYQKPKYVFFDVKDTDGLPVPDIKISVAGSSALTNNNGQANMYVFTNRRLEYEVNTIDYAVDAETITTSNDTVRFSLQVRQLNVFDVTFHIIDSATHASLPNARITIYDRNVTTDEFGWATFEKIPSRPIKYTVTANDYLISNGTININSDTLILAGITKMPLLTFNVHNNEKPVAGIGIIISNTALQTDGTGIAATRIEKTDTVPYSIAIGRTALTDTIFNLRQSATIDVNLALIDTIGTGPQPNDTVGNGQQPNDTLPPKTYSLTFYLSDGVNPIDSALITVNGIDKNTDSTGHAVFDGIADSTNIAYTISKDGYEVANGRRTLSDSMICTGNITIRLSLRKVAGTSYGTEEQAGIKIYPNPSDGLINLPDFNGQTVSIFDTNGRLVKKATVDGGRIDLRPITAGIYTLIAETQSGIVSIIIVIK